MALRNKYDYEMYLGKIITLPDTNVIVGEVGSPEAHIAALNSMLKEYHVLEEVFEPFTTADLTRTKSAFYIGCT